MAALRFAAPFHGSFSLCRALQRSRRMMSTPVSLPRRIASTASIWLVSLASGLCVLVFAAFLQWLIYDDWEHGRNPLQLFGTLLAAALTFVVVFRWQIALRRRRQEMLRHFETIEWMN